MGEAGDPEVDPEVVPKSVAILEVDRIRSQVDATLVVALVEVEGRRCVLLAEVAGGEAVGAGAEAVRTAIVVADPVYTAGVGHP